MGGYGVWRDVLAYKLDQADFAVTMPMNETHRDQRLPFGLRYELHWPWNENVLRSRHRAQPACELLWVGPGAELIGAHFCDKHVMHTEVQEGLHGTAENLTLAEQLQRYGGRNL